MQSSQRNTTICFFPFVFLEINISAVWFSDYNWKSFGVGKVLRTFWEIQLIVLSTNRLLGGSSGSSLVFIPAIFNHVRDREQE